MVRVQLYNPSPKSLLYSSALCHLALAVRETQGKYRPYLTTQVRDDSFRFNLRPSTTP
jgi:hypothetical protein